MAKDVELFPDDYQWERAQRFGVSQRGIGNALKRLSISVKNNTSASQADSKLRVEFVEKINRYQSQGRPIIYLDESGFAHDMPRTRLTYALAERVIFSPTLVQSTALKFLGHAP